MTDIRLDDIVACKLCDALVIRERRALHLDWHARLNAKLYNLGDAYERLVSEPVDNQVTPE